MFVTGALLAMFAVVLGAFGAHALKKYFEGTNYAQTWETGVRYHMYHALGLLFIGMMQMPSLFGPSQTFQTAAILMLIGMILFSGSLYALAISRIKILGAITPLGGLCLIAAWICVAIGIAA